MCESDVAVRPEGVAIALKFFRTLGREGDRQVFFGTVIDSPDGQRLWFSDREWEIAKGRLCIFMFEEVLPASGFWTD